MEINSNERIKVSGWQKFGIGVCLTTAASILLSAGFGATIFLFIRAYSMEFEAERLAVHVSLILFFVPQHSSIIEYFSENSLRFKPSFKTSNGRLEVYKNCVPRVRRTTKKLRFRFPLPNYHRLTATAAVTTAPNPRRLNLHRNSTPHNNIANLRSSTRIVLTERTAIPEPTAPMESLEMTEFPVCPQIIICNRKTRIPMKLEALIQKPYVMFARPESPDLQGRRDVREYVDGAVELDDLVVQAFRAFQDNPEDRANAGRREWSDIQDRLDHPEGMQQCFWVSPD